MEPATGRLRPRCNDGGAVFPAVALSQARRSERYAGQRVVARKALFTATAAAVLLSSRLYRGIWRYASLDDLLAITKAVTLTILVFLPILFLITRLEGFPRSLPVINWLVLLILLGGPRFAYRVLKDRRFNDPGAVGAPPRAGAADRRRRRGRAVHPRAKRDRGSPYRVVGAIDEKAAGSAGKSACGSWARWRIWRPRCGTMPGQPERAILTKNQLDGATSARHWKRPMRWASPWRGCRSSAS